jgi:hypothetical protein
MFTITVSNSGETKVKLHKSLVKKLDDVATAAAVLATVLPEAEAVAESVGVLLDVYAPITLKQGGDDDWASTFETPQEDGDDEAEAEAEEQQPS